jgi:Sulfatase
VGEIATAGSTRGALALAWAHLAVLWAFAFAKPLLDVLADSPDFFVVRGNTAGDIMLLAFGVTLVPPTLMLALELPFARVERARRLVHVALVGCLAAALALQILEDVAGGPALVLLIGAAMAGVGGAVLYARSSVAAAVLTVLAPAPLVFIALFLLFSPVSKLVLPQDDEAAPAKAADSNTPVVMVVFDELSGYSLMARPGQIDARRYPNFAGLAEDATWYPNATTVTDGTTHAVPALLSGRVPPGDVAPVTAEYPSNLFTVLGERYAFNVNEPATDLCPSRLCAEATGGTTASRLRALADDLSVVSLHLLLPDDLDNRLPAVDQTFGDFRDAGDQATAGDAQDAGIPAAAFEDPPAQWARVVARLTRTPERPSLTFVHVLLPHFPWRRLPSGQIYPTAGPALPGTESDVWSSDPAFARQGNARYLLQLGYVDRLLGALVGRLREVGLYDRALVIVTSDHGIAFEPGLPRREVTQKTFVDIASVPLFVKAPRQPSGSRDDRLALSVDVLPTVADALGIRLARGIDGRSLLRAPVDRSRLTIFALDASDASLATAEFRRRLEARVRLMTRRFGIGTTAGLFGGATTSALVGRATAEVAPVAASNVRVQLDAPLLESLDGRAKVIPVFATGVIEGEVEPGQRFAVAVNGRVAGVGAAYRAGLEMRFGALVPPDALSRRNRVEVYAVYGRGAQVRLARVARLGGEFDARLVARRDSQLVEEPSGRTTRLVAGAISGFVDSLTVDDGVVAASGWAADTQRDRVAERVLVFADGKLVAQGEPSTPRPDVAAKFGGEVELSGFGLSGIVARDNARIQVVAMSAGRASELVVAEGP